MGEETEEGEFYLSPAASMPRQRGAPPMASRLQSPTSHRHFFLGSNNDQLERTQSRAARAAAIRRKSSALHPPPSSDDRPPGFFDKEQIMELYHNCLRLASENKINQKNTWELGLIDHLSEIIRVEAQDDNETNFQKASCTLEAGVKIYSLRVDSVHSEAYKVLGGINRASQEDDNENLTECNLIRTEEEGHPSKKDLDKKVSPLSTLESSYEALNVKKFDVAFTVDPLYHQTSAQFDEGGAKCLLLNNLGVYGGCHILFDSSEAPEMCITFRAQTENSELIDLSFAKEFTEQMMIHMPAKHDISPTLRKIVNQFDRQNGRPTDICSAGQRTVVEAVVDNFQIELESNAFENSGPWSFEYDDHSTGIDDICISTDQNFSGHQEDDSDHTFQECDIDEKLGNLADFLPLVGFSSKNNAWAGPDHWKYRKTKGLEQKVSANNSELAAKRCDSDISFANYVEDKMPDIFCPPKNPRLISLPVSRVGCNIMLPEDCHYKPDNLVGLFICPNLLCLGRKKRKSSDISRQENYSFNPMPSWGCESMTNNQSSDGHIHNDEDDPDTLVCQPHQANKVDIQYDKVAKQLDVHLLKEELWNQIQYSIDKFEMDCKATVSFRQILQQFPHDSPAASPKKISPHLVFICLLHLANEHCLSIQDRPSLDELDIHIPLSAIV